MREAERDEGDKEPREIQLETSLLAAPDKAAFTTHIAANRNPLLRPGKGAG